MSYLRSVAVMGTVLGCLVIHEDGAQAQRPPPPPPPTPAAVQPRGVATPAGINVAQPIKVKPILKSPAAPAALKQVLAGKRLFDENKLSMVISYAGNIPKLRLGAKVIQLEPIQEAPVPPTAQRPLAPQLSQQLVKYQPYIAQFKFGKAILAGRTPTVGVDHRSLQTPIRDQGPRGTCVAHASDAAMESLYKKMGATKDLSENHTYNIFMQQEHSTCMADPGIQTWKAAGYLTTNRVCEESESPYVSNTSAACATIPSACASHSTHGFVATSVFFSPAFGGSGPSIATNTSFLESLLDAGNDVVLGVYAAGTDWHDSTAESGSIDVQIDGAGNPVGAFGGHAMLLVGYNATSNYFIFKNSWGTDRGHAGYLYLTYEYIQTYAKYGYVATAVTAP